MKKFSDLQCVITTVALVLSTTMAVLAGPFEDSVDAWNAGEYATALRLLRPLAEKGNVRAEFLMGFAYHNGRGVPEDDAEAVKWYRRAADKGDDIAQYNVGFMYQNSPGVPRDIVLAYMWLHLAATRGHLGAAQDRDRLAESMTPAQIEKGATTGAELETKIARKRGGLICRRCCSYKSSISVIQRFMNDATL